jgi:predicted CoA-binding protein
MSVVASLLQSAASIAVVGASPSPLRTSHQITAYLAAQGYRVFPVNPNAPRVVGLRCYLRLEDIEEPIDIVDVFRRAEHVPAIVDSAIHIGAKALWLQPGVIHEQAAARARAAGLTVVLNRCILVEHRRLRATGTLHGQ